MTLGYGQTRYDGAQCCGPPPPGQRQLAKGRFWRN
jgi:hypothetical protein